MDAIWRRYDEYPKIKEHLNNSGIFGAEWFFGHGTLYRWRPDAREEAEKRVKKHLTTRDRNCAKKLRK